MNSCPKCGGTSGYQYKLQMVTLRGGVWGGYDEFEIEVSSSRDVSSVTCLDCNKKIPYGVALGEK